MTYPGTSDFTAAQDDAAWWQVSITAPDGSQQVALCSTNGRAFVDQMQSLLNVAVDGAWGPNTSAALISRLQSISADPTLIQGVQAEAQLQRVGQLTLRGAVFYMHFLSSYGDVPMGPSVMSINIPTNVVPPNWSSASPLGPSGDIIPSCGVITSNVPRGTPGTVPIININVPGNTLTPLGTSTGQQWVVPVEIIVTVLAGVALVAVLAWPASSKPSATQRATKRRITIRTSKR